MGARLKEIVGEPKGYFPFSKARKDGRGKENREDGENGEMIKSSSPAGGHKEWSYYIKLPKLM